MIKPSVLKRCLRHLQAERKVQNIKTDGLFSPKAEGPIKPGVPPKSAETLGALLHCRCFSHL